MNKLDQKYVLKNKKTGYYFRWFFSSFQDAKNINDAYIFTKINVKNWNHLEYDLKNYHEELKSIRKQKLDKLNEIHS